MVYIFLAEGFEEAEAIFPLDLLKRAEINVKTVSVGGGEYVTGSHGICVKCDLAYDHSSTGKRGLENFILSSPEMIVLPGGMPGADNLNKSPFVHSMLADAAGRGAFLAAICAAPMILGADGYLKGREAACYPGYEKYLTGATVSTKRVVRDLNIITAVGAGAACEFGLALIAALEGSELAEKIGAAVLAEGYVNGRVQE